VNTLSYRTTNANNATVERAWFVVDAAGYLTHSGYPGGQKANTPERIRAKHPERILETAIRGMLPKNKLGRAMYKKLHVYAGAEHPHVAQKPADLPS